MFKHYYFILLISACLPLAAHAGNIDAGKTKSITCAGCHSGGGKPGISASDDFPNLAGQKKGYIIQQLKAFKSGQRKNPTMLAMASSLAEQDMKDIAAYFSSLK